MDIDYGLSENGLALGATGVQAPRRGVPGCEDDAPPVIVPRAGKTKNITIVYPYYEQPPLLERQLESWRSYPKEVKDLLRVIIVDDASPDHPARYVLANQGLPFPVSLFQIKQNVKWNQHSARNIGMKHAEDGFCLILDMDLIAPADTMLALISGAHDPDIIYRLSRRKHTGERIYPHPNAWFMTREMFWRVGGYDEELAGIWGTDDDWRRRCARTATIQVLADELVCYDATIKTQRQMRENRALKKKIIASRGKDWRPKVLSFEYEQTPF